MSAVPERSLKSAAEYMETDELKKYLMKAGNDKLCAFVLKLYEKGDEKWRRRILTTFVPKDERPKRKKETLPDSQSYLHYVRFFAENALEGNYFGPNRIITKKERSGWRATFKRLRDTALRYHLDGKPKVTAEALRLLLNVLSYASGRWVFTSERPVDVSRTDPAEWCGTYFSSLLASKEYDYPAFFIEAFCAIHPWHFWTERYDECNPYKLLFALCNTEDLKDLYFLSLTKWAKERITLHKMFDFTNCTVAIGRESEEERRSISGIGIVIEAIEKRNGRKHAHHSFWDCEYKKWFKELSDIERMEFRDTCDLISSAHQPYFFEHIAGLIEEGCKRLVLQDESDKAEDLINAVSRACMKKSEKDALRGLLFKAQKRTDEARAIKKRILDEQYSSWEAKEVAKNLL